MEKIIYPWYKCKHDFKVIISVHLILVVFLGITGYDQIGVWSKNLVNWFFIKPLTLIFIYISWSMWPYAIAFTTISVFLCLNHYLKWIIVSWVTLSVVNGYSMVVYSFGAINLRIFSKGTVTVALIHLPIFVCIAGIIYFVRKKIKERRQSNKEYVQNADLENMLKVK